VPLNNTRTTAIAVVLVAFVAGIVVGLAGDRVYLLRTHQIFPPRGGKTMTHHLVDRLDRELHFDAQQRTQVESILERRRQRIDTIWSAARPAVEKEISATNAEIEKVLRPEQVKTFKSIQMRMRGREHRRGGGPPQGPAPG
jgi:hypothetical protein